MTPLLQPPEQRWACPNCTATAVTRGAPNRFHTCAGLKGLTAPMIPDGIRCDVRAIEREDYVKDEDVVVDCEGRPVMSLITVRDDGQDCVVYAPTAHGDGGI